MYAILNLIFHIERLIIMKIDKSISYFPILVFVILHAIFALFKIGTYLCENAFNVIFIIQYWDYQCFETNCSPTFQIDLFKSHINK